MHPGGILGNRDKLKNIVPILSGSETTAFIRAKIGERCKLNRLLVCKYGRELIEWAGKDQSCAM